MNKIILSEQERNLGKFSLSNLIQYYNIDMILCNNITKMDIECISCPRYIDDDDVETWINEYNSELLIDDYDVKTFDDLTDDDIEEIIDNYGDDIMNDFCLYPDIYQWYIVRESDVHLLENDYPIYYCDELDLYILGITHCGMSWDMVYTNVEIPQFMLKA